MKRLENFLYNIEFEFVTIRDLEQKLSKMTSKDVSLLLTEGSYTKDDVLKYEYEDDIYYFGFEVIKTINDRLYTKSVEYEMPNTD